jgi:tetratricopeptide (TPR) repeat protein
MKKLKMSFVYLFLLVTCITLALANAQAQSPQQTLNQYISDLQRNPNDNALREKIIKYVQSMSPVPKIPAEVDELVGQAKYVFKHAKSQKDYLDAVEAYKKVLTITPWIGDYYYNLGVAQEQAGQLEDAIKNFNLYLLALPDAKDAREVRERIGGLKYAKEKAGQEKQAVEARARAEREQREAPKRFLNQLKYLYEGKTFRMLNCSHTATYQVCFDEAGSWPCGCNEAEMSGANWYDGKTRVGVSFPDDSTILFSNEWLKLRGKITGTSVEDITWEMPEPDSRKSNKWKPVWGRVQQCSSGPLDCLYYSGTLYDYPSIKPAHRPVNNSDFSPYIRYEYHMLKLN